MKILSFDVGIKNLAYCLLEKSDTSTDYKILKWDTINLLTTKKCNYCDKPAKFRKNDDFYCKPHAKNSDYLIPTLDNAKLQKLNVADLKSYIEKHDISLNCLGKAYKKLGNKTELLREIEEYNAKKYLDHVKEDNAGLISLIGIGINMRDRLNELLNSISGSKIDKILIENQLSNIAVRMKTLQGMITQYFIMQGYQDIEYISSTNKLKLFLEKDKTKSGEKTSYNERKKLGIKYCQDELIQCGLNEQLEHFLKHGKKDDLADSFLQGLWWIRN